MSLFQKAKALFAAAMTALVERSNTYTNRYAGKALIDHQDRVLSPAEWLRWFVGGNKRAFAAPGAPYVNRGYKRYNPPRNTQPHVCYRKRDNRDVREMERFYAPDPMVRIAGI